MVVAVMLPVIVASAFAVNKIRLKEKATAIASLHKTVDTVAMMVDRDIQSSISALNALGNSEHLQTDNFEAFYLQAKAIGRTPDTWVALLRADGTQVLNTAVAFGTPPATKSASTFVDTVLATQQPLVSSVFTGPRTGRQLVAIYVPATAMAEKKYVVAQGFALENWKDFGKTLDLPTDWIVAVIDRAGLLIARSRMSEDYVGKPARPDLIETVAENKEGLTRVATLEGIDSYVAFDRSQLSGWTVAVAAPAKLIDAAAIDAVQFGVAGFLFALLASGIMGAIFGRRLIAALQSATDVAKGLGQGQGVQRAHASIAEIDALSQTLENAAQLLEEERQARLAAELERERLLELERLARDAAQKENTAKDHFLAMLGHELRNPLAAISGAVSVLRRGNKSGADAIPYMDIINRQNRHLVHIIDDLLDMSRLIAGKIVLDRHPVDLAECLNTCLNALKAAHRLDGHTLVIEAQSIWINADPVRIEQVLNNLIGNALKFSAAGTTIQVDMQEVGAQVILRVQDQGTGIDPELMATVFEPFVQGPPPVNGTQSGMGIGLALVRQLVELHGGTITVQSDGSNHGTTFTCCFATVPAPASDPESDFTHLIAAQAATLLYVEDNDDAREVMAEILRLSGYQVIAVANGADALAAASARRPDAIVLDIGLPDMSGYDVARALRNDPHHYDGPIIALTGFTQLGDNQEAMQLGFTAHLVKPIDPNELTRTVEALLAAPGRTLCGPCGVGTPRLGH